MATEAKEAEKETKTTEFTLRDMVAAHEAGARGDAAWLEERFSDFLIQNSSRSTNIPKSELGLLSVFRNGLDFLYAKRERMELVDIEDQDMAKPHDPIRTTSAIAGLISGLNLSEHTAIATESLDKQGGLDWALWYRLGVALKKGQDLSPFVEYTDTVLKRYIHPQRAAATV